MAIYGKTTPGNTAQTEHQNVGGEILSEKGDQLKHSMSGQIAKMLIFKETQMLLSNFKHVSKSKIPHTNPKICLI